MTIHRTTFLVAAMLLTAANCLAVETNNADDAAGIAFFESKIRPVLVEHCYQCHSTKASKAEGGLQVDSRQSIRAGGESGPAVVPGDPKASLLLIAISHSEADLKMPPKKERLPESVIADVRTWIEMGAPDPRDAADVPMAIRAVDIEAGRQFWAFKQPVDHPPPTTGNPGWARRDLDHFVLAKLEENGLAPSPDAPPAVLLRRLHFDLVGLPPSPIAARNFLKLVEQRGLDAAVEAEVDALLASERFGERWGRHWLDVARYAESSGKESNLTFPYAWRYRDYVIDSVNADKPFDRFLTEQIAGDLLPSDSDRQRAERLIATGFLAIGPKGLNAMDIKQFLSDVADEQIDALTRAVMGSSVACARCHDHKFDPYSMEDYYSLAGIFSSTKTYYGTAVGPENQVGGDLLNLPKIDGQLVFNKPILAAQVTKLKDELAALQKEQSDGMAAVQKALEKGEDPTELFTLQQALRILWRSGAIEGQLETVDGSGAALALAIGVEDRDQISDAPLLERGELSRPGKPVPRGFPRVIEMSDAAPPPKDQSGRRELAQWLTSANHPLTARVMANRVWHHLFGAGIVRTVDNFGTTGEPPSHPKLLDHLALRFVDGGWSVKSLVREIALSRAYRQASTFDEAAFQKDPENRLLWRASKRRLDAEAIRDAMLLVSGRLEIKRPGGSLVAQLGDRSVSIIAFDQRVPADLDDSNHRSVYLPVLRDRLPDVLDLFDFAEPSLVTGARETTNVPVQALYLMNSPFVQKQAEGLAKRLLGSEATSDKRIRRAFKICYSRAPDEDEVRLATQFLSLNKTEDDSADATQDKTWTAYCQALLSTAEFRNLD